MFIKTRSSSADTRINPNGLNEPVAFRGIFKQSATHPHCYHAEQGNFLFLHKNRYSPHYAFISKITRRAISRAACAARCLLISRSVPNWNLLVFTLE